MQVKTIMAKFTIIGKQDLAKELILQKKPSETMLFFPKVLRVYLLIYETKFYRVSSFTKAEVTGVLKTSQDDAKKMVKPSVVKDKTINILKQNFEYFGICYYKYLISEIKLMMKLFGESK